MDKFLAVIEGTAGGVRAASLLLEYHCCSRCVLRFLNHKDPATYAEVAPSSPALRAALAARHPTPDAPATALPSPSAHAPEGPTQDVCSVCLGACQLLDGPAVGAGGYNPRKIDQHGDPIAEDLEKNSGLLWRFCGGGTEAEILEIARMDGHVFTDTFCVEPAVPAAAAVRQFALYLTLQQQLFGKFLDPAPRGQQYDELAAPSTSASDAPSGPFSAHVSGT